MSLATDLVELKSKKYSGKISAVAYYQSLVRLIDGGSSKAGAGPMETAEIVLTFVRRIKAVLDRRFGASGGNLRQKIESVQSRLTADLRMQLEWIAQFSGEALRNRVTTPAKMETFQEICEAALVETVRQGALRHHEELTAIRVTRGIVQKVRHSWRRHWPRRNRSYYHSLLDVDGHLMIVSDDFPVRIKRGDELILVGFEDHQATFWYNESTGSGKPGFRKASYSAMVLGALIALLGLAILGFAVRSAWLRDLGRFLLLARDFLLGLSGILISWLGMTATWTMHQMTRLMSALVEERKRTAAVKPLESGQSG